MQSSSAISTLLNKRLIVPKGRKETVGRPIMYGTSKDFLLQFPWRGSGAAIYVYLKELSFGHNHRA